jgi:para-nitrobenzyl esterase
VSRFQTRSDLISEDCLSLNVWTPNGLQLALAGRASQDSGRWQHQRRQRPKHGYDGHAIARRGLVVVTINYRLGSFGFFSHPALTAESPRRASGNQGLLDQVAALEWVHANIARFGGDPAAITLAGSSAGGSISPR